MGLQYTVIDTTRSNTGSNPVFNAKKSYSLCDLTKSIHLSFRMALTVLMCLPIVSCMFLEGSSMSGSQHSDHLPYNYDNQSIDIKHSDSQALPSSDKSYDGSVETNLSPGFQMTPSIQSAGQKHQGSNNDNPIHSSDLPVRIVGGQKPKETPVNESKISDNGSDRFPSQVVSESQMASSLYTPDHDSTGQKSIGQNFTAQNSAVICIAGEVALGASSQKPIPEPKKDGKKDSPSEISGSELPGKTLDGQQDWSVKQILNEALGINNDLHENNPKKAAATAELTGAPSQAGNANICSAVPKSDASLDSRMNQKHTAFYHLSQGGYKSEIQGSSEVIMMDSHEKVMDFLKYVELPNTQFNFSDWLKFDFEKEQVLAFLVRNPAKGMFVQLTNLSFDESTQSGFDVSYETFQEDSSCSLTQWMSTEVGFHLVRIKRHPRLASGSYPVRARGSQVKGCHGLLANFSQSEAASPIVSEVIWRGDVERSQGNITLFQKNWESWHQFTSKYCLECKKAESKSGFPDHQIAILVSEPGAGQLHLRKAYRSSGILFLDLERDDCEVEKNSILFLVRKKDLGLPESMLDQSKIALTGPWIPRTKTCVP